MRDSVRLGAGLIFLAAGLVPCSIAQKHERVQRDEKKVAPDGVTEGWVLTYDNPDPDRRWERLPLTLVVARRGKVVRRWEITTVQSWVFWEGGREVAYEEGGLHGPGSCFLVSVRTGRRLEEYPAECDDPKEDAPGWVKLLQQ